MQLITKRYPFVRLNESNVFLSCNGQPYRLDDDELYKKVQEGDLVNILIHDGYNEHDELKKSYITIES